MTEDKALGPVGGEPTTDDLLVVLSAFLADAGMEPDEPRWSDDELRQRLTAMLGREPAPDVEAWFRFSERWRLRMVAPTMIGALDVETATQDRADHGLATGEVANSSLIVAGLGEIWDAVPIGAELSGSIYVLSPATAAGALVDEPRLCRYQFDEAFFFPGDRPSSAPSVTNRDELPTLLQWLLELTKAFGDGRVVSDGRGGFVMAGAEGAAKHQEYPWPHGFAET